jgi:hypothetical protein
MLVYRDGAASAYAKTGESVTPGAETKRGGEGERRGSGEPDGR